MYARKVITHAAIHWPVNTAYEFALGFFHEFEDTREVQATGCICIGPTEPALEFYGSWHNLFSAGVPARARLTRAGTSGHETHEPVPMNPVSMTAKIALSVVH